jgi:hypothetical protein
MEASNGRSAIIAEKVGVQSRTGSYMCISRQALGGQHTTRRPRLFFILNHQDFKTL